MRSLPTLVEPVKDILRTVSEEQSNCPIPGVFSNAVTILMTPGGMPARAARTAKAFAEKGVSPADLRTTVQPAASAGPIFRVTMPAGKFHLVETSAFHCGFEWSAEENKITYGVISPQTPTGSLMIETRNAFELCGTTSPYMRAASSENHSRKLAAKRTSPSASALALPFSVVIRVARSRLFSRTSSYQRRRILPLSRPDRERQAGNAFAAASIAFCASEAVDSGQVPILKPVAGSERDVNGAHVVTNETYLRFQRPD